MTKIVLITGGKGLGYASAEALKAWATKCISCCDVRGTTSISKIRCSLCTVRCYK